MLEYSAGLTGEPFLYNETKIIASYILNGEDEKILRKRNVEENLIQYKASSAINRVNSPIFKRINVFNKDMLNEFVNGDIITSKMLLIYAIMKTDRLICDFIVEIYKEKILLMQDYIDSIEIINWFEKIYDRSERLYKVSDKTKYKLKQVLLKIMLDSGLIVKEHEKYRVISPILSEKFKKLLEDNNDIDYYKAIGGLA